MESFVETHMVLEQPTLQGQLQDPGTDWQRALGASFQLPHRNYPQEAHTAQVYAIQLDGKWLVSGGADNTVRVWDLETQRLRDGPLTGHSQSVLCLQFDPTNDEDVIISGSVDGSVIVWRFSTGDVLRTIPSAHESSILDLQFNRRHLFTCSKDKTIKIWNRHELTSLDKEQFRFHDGPNTSIPAHVLDVLSAEPSFVEARLVNSSIRCLESYTHLATLQGHVAAVNAIDTYGDLLISGGGDGAIRVWDTTTGQCIRLVVPHKRGIACIRTDGKRVICGSSDNSVRIYDLESGAEVAVLLGHSNIARTIQPDFEGDLSIIANGTHKLRHGSEDLRCFASIATVKEPQSPSDVQYENEREKGTFLDPISNSGSSDIENDSTWDRVVSGSYDESIIIWKRDSQGHWFIEHTIQLRAVAASHDDIDYTAQANSSSENDHANRGQQEPSLRVFKVKFDARRLVCSSQDSRIYGWGFADDHAEIADQDVEDSQEVGDSRWFGRALL